jgi:hypothetical protein
MGNLAASSKTVHRADLLRKIEADGFANRSPGVHRMRLQIKSKPVWLGVLIAISAIPLGIGCNSSHQTVDQFPIHKQTKYFDFRYERDSSQADGLARFADGYVNLINRDFFKTDFDYPIRVFVLEDQKRFEEFAHKELHVPGPAGFGMYLYSAKLLATYEGSGLGTFTHEAFHAFVEKDLTQRPSWADEGIPTFFEKFYGYWKDDELVLFWGFQNPWRIRELGINLTQLNLPEIISEQNPEQDESKLRMVSLFLWRQGRFKRLLKLIAANDKRGYKSFFEAALELPLDRITPLWQDYLLDVERQRTIILSLPISAVFDSEEAFRTFAKLHSIPTEQVHQRD